jgi:hypothetical protein
LFVNITHNSVLCKFSGSCFKFLTWFNMITIFSPHDEHKMRGYCWFCWCCWNDQISFKLLWIMWCEKSLHILCWFRIYFAIYIKFKFQWLLIPQHLISSTPVFSRVQVALAKRTCLSILPTIQFCVNSQEVVSSS